MWCARRLEFVCLIFPVNYVLYPSECAQHPAGFLTNFQVKKTEEGGNALEGGQRAFRTLDVTLKVIKGDF